MFFQSGYNPYQRRQLSNVLLIRTTQVSNVKISRLGNFFKVVKILTKLDGHLQRRFSAQIDTI